MGTTAVEGAEAQQYRHRTSTWVVHSHHLDPVAEGLRGGGMGLGGKKVGCGGVTICG